jgi:hypothetical protein
MSKLIITCPLHDSFHGFVLIPLDFSVGDAAVTLRGGNPFVAQDVLDGYQCRVGIKHLRCHDMAQSGARHP